jgi:hypothetical protein
LIVYLAKSDLIDFRTFELLAVDFDLGRFIVSSSQKNMEKLRCWMFPLLLGKDGVAALWQSLIIKAKWTPLTDGLRGSLEWWMINDHLLRGAPFVPEVQSYQ